MAKAKAKATRKAQSSDSTVQWIAKTQGIVAEFFGVTTPAVVAWARLGMPGRRGFYDLAAIYKWLQSRAQVDRKSDPADMLRLEKAKMARLARLEMEKELVSVASVNSVLTEFARHLRELGEHCRKEYGESIVELFNEKIDDAVGELERADSDSSHPT